MEKYWTKSHFAKGYTMESHWTCTKVRLAYLAKKGELCGVVLE